MNRFLQMDRIPSRHSARCTRRQQLPVVRARNNGSLLHIAAVANLVGRALGLLMSSVIMPVEGPYRNLDTHPNATPVNERRRKAALTPRLDALRRQAAMPDYVDVKGGNRRLPRLPWLALFRKSAFGESLGGIFMALWTNSCAIIRLRHAC